jgi:PAS domain S-box-containing protein
MAIPESGDGLSASSERLFHTIVESAPNGVVVVDQLGAVVLVNRETERMFGYTRQELIGQPIERLVPRRFQPGHAGVRENFFRNPQRRAMGAGRDLFGIHKNGTEIPVEIGLNPIETDEGVLVLASVVDIGPRKKAEEELHRSNEELQRFAYVASHDLQEPLRTVASYVQLLARRYRDALDSDAADFIDFAVAGVTRMQKLIEDLLAFSRVGTHGAALVETDAEVTFQAALDNLHAALRDANAVITHDPLPIVLADPSQFEQLLTNLLGNALKFTADRPTAVHIGVTRDGRHWTFVVRDNGIGIDPQYFERIFVIFQRLHGRDEYQGTGVGLAICKKIVERHGGRLWVDSVPGEGASFSFTLLAPTE